MKKLLIISFLLLFGLNGFGKIEKITRVDINDSAIILNENFEFTLPIHPDSLEILLGIFRFHRGKPNSIVFWDSLGFMGFIPNNQELINSFDICNSPSNYYETINFYHGQIYIQEKEIPSEINNLEFKTLFMLEKSSWRYKLIVGIFQIQVEFDEDNGELIGLEILKVN